MPPTAEIDARLFDVILLRIQFFICIGIVVFFALRLLGQRVALARLPGLWAIAIFVITSSLYDLTTFTDYVYHRVIFGQLSEAVFNLRFTFSILLRLTWIGVGIGLMLRRPWARQLALYLSLFTIATIMWKHPYYVFENIAIMVEQEQAYAPLTHLQYPEFPWITMFVYVCADIIISAVIITYLTLASVAGHFRHDNKAQ
jgi:hypothetical protein